MIDVRGGVWGRGGNLSIGGAWCCFHQPRRIEEVGYFALLVNSVIGRKTSMMVLKARSIRPTSGNFVSIAVMLAKTGMNSSPLEAFRIMRVKVCLSDKS